jgi:RNA polymerase sigma factor (sigma-70 family)
MVNRAMTEQALVDRFEQIIAQHKGILFKVARTYCARADDRDDLVQDMMIQVWRALPSYNDQFALSTWLYRIALNVAISNYRKNTRRLSSESPLTEQIVALSTDKPSEKEQVLQQLEQQCLDKSRAYQGKIKKTLFTN